MISEKAKRIIEDWRLGFVASVDAGGRPNVSPKGTFVVLDATTIAFAEMRSPNTMRNIADRPEVEVNFVDMLSRRGVRLRGQARIAHRGGEEFDALYPRFHAIWGDGLGAMFNAIVPIAVTDVKPLQSPAYEAGASEAELRSEWMQRIIDNNERVSAGLGANRGNSA